jgi:hypothetical protein
MFLFLATTRLSAKQDRAGLMFITYTWASAVANKPKF